MSNAEDLVPVPGSEREVPEGGRVIGEVDPDETFEVSVLLRPASPEEHASAHAEVTSGQRAPLSREEYARQLGASEEDVAAVEEFARARGLEVTDVSRPRRTVVLRGTASALSGAFGVSLARCELGAETYRVHTGPVRLPPELAPRIAGVFGFDTTPQARPLFRVAPPQVIAAPEAAVSYSPLDIARAYSFPADAIGSGQAIGIIELGGGFDQQDLVAYFQSLGLATPAVYSVSVDGGTNSPTGDPNGPDAEVLLDLEVAGAVANGVTLVVYFAPNTDRGFIDAVTTAVHDATNNPLVISISWGGPESTWSSQSLTAMDQAFQAAGTMGVTVCCASGDQGSGDGVGDGLAHVDFPASSPHVLGCGGTTLTLSSGTIQSETAWSDASGATGGGVSDAFALPDWQSGADVPPSANPGGRVGRGVPDVAGNADPQTGYRVHVDGQDLTVGGTSAVAPLWAGLVALLNQSLGRPLGFVNVALYSLSPGSGAFHDVTEGSNGAYQAGTGWDACTGLGSPDGQALASALGSSAEGSAP